ncbi:YL1 nuclear protein domain-containing protein [Theileria equi strain WA]|uniref:YL1 nuclear protein domain-containing protein n=1 Tax=Theileria equi strain WA TaxID=1537102 RepID=L0B0X9_THEEQ|nr:YL1 nuclear protein domain-containing protein [Theileria equi strain WA]AFZ81470.1 YL1 nuclear protein domain-containing protein [Theileria equi strain WA]|eukprot:XP_004831136.1 YL1 nuclear protein domain-containing protein [Theileria equi strain WA]
MSSSEEYSDSSEDSFDESKVGIALELPKRENRGKKYSKLVGEELEKDIQFWGHSTWDEDAVDDDYNCSEGEEQYAYSTDSDFDDPEEQQSDGEVDESHLKERKKKKHGAYVDPVLLRNKRTMQAIARKRAAESQPKKPSTPRVYTPQEEVVRERRATTKMKTEAVKEMLEYRDIKRKKVSAKKTAKPTHSKVFTQEELMEMAKKTEIANKKSLESLQAWEDEKKKYNEPKKQVYKGHYDIWISWNSLLSIVVHNEEEQVNETQPTNQSDVKNEVTGDEESSNIQTDGKEVKPEIEEKPLELYMFTTGMLPEFYRKVAKDKLALKTKSTPTCVITGKTAKYFDPLTRNYYSDLESFKSLRVYHFNKKYNSMKSKLDTIEGILKDYINNL